MKTTFFKSTFYFLTLFLILGVSCSPEDGAPGPAGPSGANGQDGQDGNANVVSVLLSNQSVTTGNNTFTVAELTQDIFDNGFVYGYVTVNGNNYWETIPVVTIGNTILDIDAIRIGEIDIETTFNQSGLNFRFILVAGNTNKTSVDISNMSYEEALIYFGLNK